MRKETDDYFVLCTKFALLMKYLVVSHIIIND